MGTQAVELAGQATDWNCCMEAEGSGSETVLYVEDEAFVRDVTSEVLRSAGYEVWTARNAEEAQHIYDRNQGAIDLLITDVILPGENGRALARRLRIADSALKVLLVSGYAEQLGTDDATGEDCLAKPFATTQLLRRVRQGLDRVEISA